MSEAEAWNGVMAGGNPAPSCAGVEENAAKGGFVIGVATSAIAVGSMYVGGKIGDYIGRKQFGEDK